MSVFHTEGITFKIGSSTLLEYCNDAAYVECASTLQERAIKLSDHTNYPLLMGLNCTSFLSTVNHSKY